MRKLELLAPARDLATAVDAVDCGADAVYMGAPRFGARYAAGNTVEDIRKAAEYAHLYGARLYVTLNTLLYEGEVEEARELAMQVAGAGADALIVQDVAYCRMGLPIELHASTQTNCASAERVRFFEQVGFSRAVLERSLSLDEIGAIRRSCGIELEAFVHGAICVSHSGRCFLSRSTSERSGNRGECSQPCRLPYDLVDGKGNKIITGKHLLSVRDLDLSARLGEMIDAGITSFKIEGRLKERTYVRNTVSHYRRLLDAEIALRSDCCRSSVGISETEFSPDPAKSFTRGAETYFFDGKRAGVASFDTPKAMGEYIGRVTKVASGRVTLDRNCDLGAGDGICFITGGEAVGTNINAAEGNTFIPNRADGIAAGCEIYRNYDRRFSLAVERSRNRRTIGARIAVRTDADCIRMRATDETGVSAEVCENVETSVAENPEKMRQTLLRQTAKSGDTIFRVEEVKVEGEVRFAPASAIGAVRRRLLDALAAERLARHPKSLPFAERAEARYPQTELSEQDNVTNSVARSFYLSHGVERITGGLDTRPSTAGCRVMVSDYCIRREIGECLRERHTLAGDLYLVRGRKRYALRFDCAECRMSLTDVNE